MAVVGADAGAVQDQNQTAAAQEQVKAERLNLAVQQQLNLESVKIRAIGLFNAISRILEHIELHSRSNTKWQETLGQFSMVNMELFNIVEDIKKVSKSFVVHLKNVNGEYAIVLPVMLSSKLLPEMEAEDNTKREQLLHGRTNLPVTTQIEKLKARIDMVAAACDTVEKVIADARKQYGLGSRQGPSLVPTVDKAQAAKIQEQEHLLRAAVNSGEALRITGDQRYPPPSLPSHLVDVLIVGDVAQNPEEDNSGMLQKSTPPFSYSNINPQAATMQTTAQQSIGRSVPSPSGGPAFFDHASTPPLPYMNSPRSGPNTMNTPSPQQQAQQQQQRQKMLQIPQAQLIAQQQMRQSANPVVLGQGTMPQLNDLTQPKFQSHQMQYSQPLVQQQYQNRQLPSAHMQLNMTQHQMNQGNPLRSRLGQFTGSANSALFNAAQSSPNSQLLTNMQAPLQSQSLRPRMQFNLPGGQIQRNHPSQILNDQMNGMGASNQASIVAMQRRQQQQQQQQQQGGFGNTSTN